MMTPRALFRKFKASLASLARCNEGSSLAELALALPVLMLLLGGSVEISRAIYQYGVITKGVQDATRFLARRDEIIGSGECPPGLSWASAVVKAQTLALTGSLNGTTDYLLSHWTDLSTVTVTVRCEEPGSLVSPLSTIPGTLLPIVVVSATVPFNDVGLLGLLGVDAFSISVEHSELGTGG